jgi:uncharacterized membrane protein YoaK (UPF0700 family)
MIRYSRRIKLLAAGLAALAGFVDATGFLKLGGFFVSFMSGNTTRLAVGLAEGTTSVAVAGGLIFTFVLGVIAGTFVGHFVGKQRAASILAFVSFLLTVSAGFGATGFSICAIVAMTLAMGAINAVFAHDGEVRIGLTYMTGTLVKFGQQLANAVLGGDPWAWWPYFLLWFGLACGAVAGALLYPYLGLNSLWVAAFAAALFARTAMHSGLALTEKI